FNDLGGLLYRTTHTISARGQHDLSTIGAQHHTTFIGHGFWHSEDNSVATCSTHHGQDDTGIAGSTFNNGATGAQLAGFLCSVNNGYTDTVFDRVRRIIELNLDRNVARETFCESVETNQWSLTDCLSNVIEHFCHMGIILCGCGVQALKTVLLFNNRRSRSKTSLS